MTICKETQGTCDKHKGSWMKVVNICWQQARCQIDFLSPNSLLTIKKVINFTAKFTSNWIWSNALKIWDWIYIYIFFFQNSEIFKREKRCSFTI